MQFDNAWPLAEDAVTISQVLPSIMGADSPRTYLIMAQNEDELRATGGFISGAGIISLDDGQVTSISFTDTYRIDDWKHKPYDLPPEPYTEFMGMDIFLFRDSNYWPNFPTSAEQAMQLYTYGQNVPLDGVIAIDQRFLQLLLKATGPISVPELERVIRAADVIEQVRSEWGPGANDNGNSKNWIGQRKAFMGPLANALKNKLEGDLITIDQVALVRAIKQGIEQGHLQIYMRDPNIQKALSKAGWDGNVNANPGHDFLLVIDTNLGFNKVNAAVKRSFDYHIMLDDDDSGRGELAIRYDHTAPAKNEPCLHGTEYGNDTQYEDLIIDCYWNYLRVYVPEGTNLIEASTHPLSSNQLLSQREWAGEARSFYDQTVPSTVTFDNFLLIKPGQQQDVRFYYDLPQIVTKLPNGNKLYQLLIAKQAGTDGETVKITIELPLGRKFIHSNLEAAQVDGQVIILESKLNADLLINVEYR